MTSLERAMFGGRTRRAQRLTDVIRAESLKARTLWAQRVLWVGAAVGGIIGSAAALTFAEILSSIDADLPDGEIVALISRAPTAGAPTLALLLGFAAIHLSASEHASRRDRLTDIEVPSRSRTLVARLVVIVTGSFLISLVGYVTGGLLTAGYNMLYDRGDGYDLVAQLLSWLVVALATSLAVLFAGCIGVVVRNGVAAAGTYAAVFIAIPAALGTLSATSGSDVYAWLSLMMPAGRLGAVVEGMSSIDIVAAASALGVLAVWATVMVGIASAVWLRTASVQRGGK